MKWYEFWSQPRVLFVICFLAFVACTGCKTNDGWTKAEIDYLNQHIPEGVHVND